MPGSFYLDWYFKIQIRSCSASVSESTMFNCESSPASIIMDLISLLLPSKTKFSFASRQSRFPSRSALIPEESQLLQMVRSSKMFFAPF